MFYIEVGLVPYGIDIHAIVVVIINLILSQTLNDTWIDGSWTFIEPVTAKGQWKKTGTKHGTNEDRTTWMSCRNLV